MLYDARLNRDGNEQRVTLTHDGKLGPGDVFSHGDATYVVTGVDAGHDEFDGVVEADWTGDFEAGRFVPQQLDRDEGPSPPGDEGHRPF